MTGPIRVPDDTADAVKDYLKAALAGRFSSAPTVGLVLPQNWTPKNAPAVVVFDDGGPSEWPIVTEPRIRVTVWASGRTVARQVAAACVGLLLSRDVPRVAAVRDPSSILDARDDNGGIMASFTVAVKSRTVVA
ncbi:hypothetical protein [Rhodococcus pyridinivorans]